MIWAALAGLAALAALLLAWPLWRRPAGGEDRALAIYRDQLAELDAEAASGALAKAEAEGARLEVQRRLLRAAEAKPATLAKQALSPRFVLPLMALVLLGSALIYLAAGRPRLPSAQPPEDARHDAKLEPLLDQLRAHLAKSGGDPKGWQMLAQGDALLNRNAEAAAALSRAAALKPGDAGLRTELGEALVAAANGMVTPAARLAFNQALALDAAAPAPRYFLGLERVQAGKLEEGRKIWADLAAGAPPDAPWLPGVQQKLAALDARLNVQGMASQVAQMSPDQQQQMIRGMVDRLEAKLQADPNDAAGWERLGQARAVLGEPDKARAAYDRALALLDPRGADYRRVRMKRAELGK